MMIMDKIKLSGFIVLAFIVLTREEAWAVCPPFCCYIALFRVGMMKPCPPYLVFTSNIVANGCRLLVDLLVFSISSMSEKMRLQRFFS